MRRFDAKFSAGSKACATLPVDLNFTIASDLGRNVTRDRFHAPTVAETARIALT
jgi:hypothetical protein